MRSPDTHPLRGRLLTGLLLLGLQAGCSKDKGIEPPPPVPVTLSVAPPSVSFAARAGDDRPASQAIAVTSAGSGPANDIQATIAYADGQPGNWLSASLGGQSAPTSLTIQPTTTSLDPGSYSATVRVASANATNGAQSVAVKFDIGAPPPAIGFDADALSFAATLCGAEAAEKAVQVMNKGGGSLTGLKVDVAYADGQPSGWLAASINSATAPASLTVRPSLGALPAGSYSAKVTVSSDAAGVPSRSLVASFVVSGAPSIKLSRDGVSFSAPQDGANPAAEVVGIASGCTAAGAIKGLAADISFDGQVGAWLSASLDATDAPANLTLKPVITSLKEGVYKADVVVRSSVAGVEPRHIAATVTIGAAITYSLTVNADPAAAGSVTRTPALTAYAANAPVSLQAVAAVGWQFAGWSGDVTSSLNPVQLAMTSNKSVKASFSLKAPDLIAPTVLSSGLVNMAWNYDWPCLPAGSLCNYGGQDHYELEESTNAASGFTVVFQSPVGARTTPYNTSLARVGGTYFYRVRAMTVFGYSAYSPVRSIVAPAALTAPTSLAASPASPTQINLAWSNTANGATSVRIERCSGASCSNYAEVASVAPTVTSYQNVGLSPATSYNFRVRASNAAQNSGYSNIATAETPNAVTQFRNAAVWPVVSLVVDGVERLTTVGATIMPGTKLDLGLAVGSHAFTASTGVWQGLTRVKMYAFSGTFAQTPATGEVVIDDPSISQLMTDFSASRLWTAPYQVAFVTITLNLRFNANGTCTYQFGSGTIIGCKYSLVDYQANAVKFRVNFDSGEIGDAVLNEQEHTFTLSKAPATTSILKFTNTGQQ